MKFFCIPRLYRCFIPLLSSSQHLLCIQSAVSGPELALIIYNLICRIDCFSPSQYPKDIIHFLGGGFACPAVFSTQRLFGRWEVVGAGDEGRRGGALRRNNAGVRTCLRVCFVQYIIAPPPVVIAWPEASLPEQLWLDLYFFCQAGGGGRLHKHKCAHTHFYSQLDGGVALSNVCGLRINWKRDALWWTISPTIPRCQENHQQVSFFFFFSFFRSLIVLTFLYSETFYALELFVSPVVPAQIRNKNDQEPNIPLL